MRVIMRRERPHQGAQLRFEDVGGYRLTAFATNTKVGQLADLEVRHRLRARCEDRIRRAKDTGLDRFPLQGFDQNRIWCLIVALACDLLAFSQLLAMADAPARAWEPRTIRLRLMAIPAVITHHARRTILRYKAARYLVGGPGWSGAGPAAVGTGVLPLSADDPGAKVTCGSRALVTADKGNVPLRVRSNAYVGAGAGLSTGWPCTHAARGGTKMDIGDIEVFIGTGRRQGASTGPRP